MTAALGDRMRKLMRQHGINQSQLAARAGTTQPNISKYLAGEREHVEYAREHSHRSAHHIGILLGLPESNADTPFGTIKAYCARHGGDLSEAETRELIMTSVDCKGTRRTSRDIGLTTRRFIRS